MEGLLITKNLVYRATSVFFYLVLVLYLGREIVHRVRSTYLDVALNQVFWSSGTRRTPLVRGLRNEILYSYRTISPTSSMCRSLSENRCYLLSQHTTRVR